MGTNEKCKVSYPIELADVDCKGIDIVELVKHTLSKDGEDICIRQNENNHFSASTSFEAELRNNRFCLLLNLEYDADTIYKIQLGIVQDETDLTDYSMEVKLYYYENLDIYRSIQEIRDENEFPKTVRVYKIIYNSHPIKGTYSFNWMKCKIMFHTIEVAERSEPLTEQILAFDVKVKAKNIQDARAKAYNIVSDFSNYLSVLLDIGFYNPQSVYRNFVRLTGFGYQRKISHERYRTSFIDSELGLVIKDNLNGIATLKDVQKGENLANGVVSVTNPEDRSITIIEKYGKIEHVEEVFEKHRLEKVQQIQPVYRESLKEDLFVLGQEIDIPRCIRSYFRGIDSLESKTQKAFRNSARLYNKSCTLGLEESSFQISLLVASVESLAKSERLSYSDFIKKYYEDAPKKDVDDMYEIRSKLLHSGEFSFFEFDLNMNPYLNPVFDYLMEKYTNYRLILRRTIINWVKLNVLYCD